MLNQIYNDSIAVYKTWTNKIILQNLNTLKRDSLLIFEKSHNLSLSLGNSMNGGRGDYQSNFSDFGMFDSTNNFYAAIDYNYNYKDSISYWTIRIQEKNESLIRQFNINKVKGSLPKLDVCIDGIYNRGLNKNIIDKHFTWIFDKNNKPTLMPIGDSVLLSNEKFYKADENETLVEK
jgi:hypothetical protein